MFRISFILVVCLLIIVPFSADAAEDAGIVGSNLGLDFYSRIDDTGDALARGIVKRRLSEKGTYGGLGCGSSWIADIRIDQNDLEALRGGNTAILVQMALTKKIHLTTSSESTLRQCLIEKYDAMQTAAHQDQNIMETVGNVGLYMDGDIGNSDYDIAADIAHINSIIFKQKLEYTGTRNMSAQAIADMLANKPIALLLPSLHTPSSSLQESLYPNQENPGIHGIGSGGTASGSDVMSPWAGVCQVNSGSSSTITGFFDNNFLSDIETTLIGEGGGAGMAYTPGGILGGDGSFDGLNGGNSSSHLTSASDFYHTLPCDGIYCITINMRSGNKGGMPSGNSIEGLLEKHSEMMEPISRSNLALQEMTHAMYQLPFMNLKLKNIIPNNIVKLAESPQLAKTLKKEDTNAKKEDVFDAAYRCAMAEAGLQGDPILDNGFGGAGYTYLSNQTTANISTRILPVTPIQMDNLSGCYALRVAQGQSVAHQSFSTDLNEIQGFTSAMMSTIMSILESDKSIDKLPTK